MLTLPDECADDEALSYVLEEIRREYAKVYGE